MLLLKIQQEIRRKKATITDIYPFLNDSNPSNIITATDIITTLTNQHNIETSILHILNAHAATSSFKTRNSLGSTLCTLVFASETPFPSCEKHPLVLLLETDADAWTIVLSEFQNICKLNQRETKNLIQIWQRMKPFATWMMLHTNASTRLLRYDLTASLLRAMPSKDAIEVDGGNRDMTIIRHIDADPYVTRDKNNLKITVNAHIMKLRLGGITRYSMVMSEIGEYLCDIKRMRSLWYYIIKHGPILLSEETETETDEDVDDD